MTEVTPEMRKAWFYSEGWYADDSVILRWYIDNYSIPIDRKKKESK